MPPSPYSQADLKSMIEKAGYAVIGQRIRRIRLRANITIRQLADKAQVSKNTLLSLEQGNPTHLSTIKVICRALKMKPEELAGAEFTQPAVVAVHRNSDDVWFDMNSFVNGDENSPLGPGPHADTVTPFCLLNSRFGDGRFNPNVVELTQATPSRSHRGEEFVYVLGGRIRVNVGTQVFDLETGDSMCFWAAETHNYEPLGDDLPARILSIILDPFPRLHKFKPEPVRLQNS